MNSRQVFLKTQAFCTPGRGLMEPAAAMVLESTAVAALKELQQKD
jgi:hypothetical protein